MPALLALACAGLLAGPGIVGIALVSDHVEDRGLVAGLGLVVGWSFIGTGLFACWRRPENRIGALMAAVGVRVVREPADRRRSTSSSPVSDDGAGAAQMTRGSGLHGLADRVAALDGTLELHSPAGEGTRVRVEIAL